MMRGNARDRARQRDEARRMYSCALRKRLLDVFSYMRKRNIAARARFMCCGNCATTALFEMVEKRKNLGGVYWHEQDEENLRNGSVYLGFFSVTEKDEDAVEIAKTLVEMLRKVGLHPIWKGDVHTKVLVSLENEMREKAEWLTEEL